MGYQFYHMLLHIGKSAKDSGFKALEHAGIHPGQAWLLDVVARFGPIKQAEAAAVLNVRLPAVSRMVKGMEREGLINRERSDNDDRVILLSLTTAGMALLPRIREAWSTVEEKLMENFTDDERTTFRKLMIQAAENLTRQ
jgi:MarR family transcriptional regulator, organic hydroperoxide resistance regulator